MFCTSCAIFPAAAMLLETLGVPLSGKDWRGQGWRSTSFGVTGCHFGGGPAVIDFRQVPMASNPVSKLSEEQYLAIERAAEFRSEFVDGEMFAMSGASIRHIRIQQESGWRVARLSARQPL